jgi:hypothetical protein
VLTGSLEVGYCYCCTYLNLASAVMGNEIEHGITTVCYDFTCLRGDSVRTERKRSSFSVCYLRLEFLSSDWRVGMVEQV